jgi:hypothetical protein
MSNLSDTYVLRIRIFHQPSSTLMSPELLGIVRIPLDEIDYEGNPYDKEYDLTNDGTRNATAKGKVNEVCM